MKLIVFGNPALPYDRLAVRVGLALKEQGVEVLHVEQPTELLELRLDEYLILDVAEGIAEPRLIEDPDRLVLGRLSSLHDFDMAYFLKLMKATGRLDKIRILALPIGMDILDAVDAVRHHLAERP